MTCDVLGDTGRWRVDTGRECAVHAVKVGRTMAFITICFSENLRVLTVRSFRNHLCVGITRNLWMLGGERSAPPRVRRRTRPRAVCLADCSRL